MLIGVAIVAGRPAAARVIVFSFHPDLVPALAPQGGLSIVAAVNASPVETPFATVAGSINEFSEPEKTSHLPVIDSRTHRSIATGMPPPPPRPQSVSAPAGSRAT
jgi:hypothetical protein